jgi:hypothetical protein
MQELSKLNLELLIILAEMIIIIIATMKTIKITKMARILNIDKKTNQNKILIVQ